MNHILRILLFLTLLNLSCERKYNSVQNDFIVIGNKDNLIISMIDTTLISGYYDRKTFSLDVDFDGVNDIDISSYAWGSSGLGTFKMAEISCLNSTIALNQESIVDTIFWDRFHTVVSDGSKILIEHYDSCSCNETELSYRMYVRDETTYTKAFIENDTISKDDNWAVDTTNLSYYASGGASYDILYESNDTVVRLYTTKYKECNGFPNNMDSYIGIKKDVFGIEKLGWIKIRIRDYYIISILEIALQE